MTSYAAFLRGINVGGRIIKMPDLKSCFEDTGFANVTTVLQSGNVLFEADQSSLLALKEQIETKLTKTFNYPAKAQVLTLSNLRQIIADYPFGAASYRQHDYVIFLENGLEKPLLEEDCKLAKGENVQAGRGVVYWRVDKGSTLQSQFAKLLTKSKYKAFNTNRNLKTLQKLI
jgi:uncharacterized protein (DUF1697 family)